MSLELVRILGDDGALVNQELFESLKLKPPFCKELYKNMVLLRLMDREGRVLGNTGKRADPTYKITLWIGPYGQEAAEIASAMILPPGTWTFEYGRSIGVLLGRGVSPELIFDLYFGNCTEERMRRLIFERRAYPPYVTVGIHLSHAVGAAWAEQLNGGDNVVAAYFGDGAVSEGYFHEAMNWASIYKIPVIFFCENNQYAISTPVSLNSATSTFAEKALAYGMDFEYADGNDPFAVIYVTRKAIRRAKVGRKPTLIELVTYRMGPHTTAAHSIVKIPPEERLRSIAQDPLKRTQRFLLSDYGKTNLKIDWREELTQNHELFTTLQAASENERTRFLRDTHVELRQEDVGIFAAAEETVQTAVEAARKTYIELSAKGQELVDATVAWHKTPRAKQYTSEDLAALDHAGLVKDAPDIPFRDAMALALYDSMRRDPAIVYLGEDVGRAGGVMRATALRKDLVEREPFITKNLPRWQEYILEQFLPLEKIFPGRMRITDTPLDERGIIGTGLGFILNHERPLRPVMEIQFSGFIRIGLDQAEEFPRMLHRSCGTLDIPGVIIMPFGSGGGDRIEFHKENEMYLFLNSPGFIVVCPSNPQDAYDMYRAALASNRPVVYFAHIDLYRVPKIETLLRRPPSIPIEDFGVRVAREGDDITVVAYGRMVNVCLAVAEKLEAEKISVEVLDLRVVSPLREGIILSSVEKTGRIIAVDEGPKAGNVGAEVLAIVAENKSLESLRARARRITSPPTYPPPSKYYPYYIPQPEEIELAVQETVHAEE